MARVPRVFCVAPLKPGTIAELPGNSSHHILRVLRLRPGDSLRLFNDTGSEYSAELVSGGRERARVHVDQPFLEEAPPKLEVHLILGVSRGQRMDFALQKATELGVTEITPVFTERSVVRLDADKKAQRTQHWRQVIVSACEQSGRCRLPVLHPSTEFPGWLDGWAEGGLLLDPEAESTLATLDPPGVGIGLLVGPEGGLSASERAAARARNFNGVRLGPRILRTETAPLAAIAAVQMLWGDFR